MTSPLALKVSNIPHVRRICWYVIKYITIYFTIREHSDVLPGQPGAYLKTNNFPFTFSVLSARNVFGRGPPILSQIIHLYTTDLKYLIQNDLINSFIQFILLNNYFVSLKSIL